MRVLYSLNNKLVYERVTDHLSSHLLEWECVSELEAIFTSLSDWILNCARLQVLKVCFTRLLQYLIILWHHLTTAPSVSHMKNENSTHFYSQARKVPHLMRNKI